MEEFVEKIELVEFKFDIKAAFEVGFEEEMVGIE